MECHPPRNDTTTCFAADSLNEKTGHREPVFVMLMGNERVMGFEPTTVCLGSRDSTTELHPPVALLQVC
jgi:5-deoxy-D-glucuronate isomerase